MKDTAVGKLFTEFFESEKTAGLLLILCTAASLMAAHSPMGEGYVHFWHRDVGLALSWLRLEFSVQHWINDGLMAVFFLLVGLEIEREIYAGELSSIGNAALPVIAALGGMAVPAAIHFALNHGAPTQSGIGIPMATDIAFALGVLSLAGKRIPASLKIFLAALAIIDDLGAIVIIALFYSKGISALHLSAALGIFALLLALNRLRVRRLAPYLVLGCVMWYFMVHSGVHATITGVMLAFAVPFTRDGRNPSLVLQHFLHRPVAFIILPLFAMANTGIVIDTAALAGLLSTNALGIIAGLALGKPMGILLFSVAGTAMGVCRLPEGVGRLHLLGAGMLGGVGFTMSIFIANLAFDDALLVRNSIMAILAASLIAGTAGFLLLKLLPPKDIGA